jgi:hypothetical protein
VFEQLGAALGGGARGREALVAIMADQLMTPVSQPARTLQLKDVATDGKAVEAGREHG